MITSKTIHRTARVFALFVSAILLLSSSAIAQTRQNVFQPGEQLVYKVKYGFVKLGTVVIQTGNMTSDGKMDMRMQFWTADVPFLHAKTTVTDQFDSRDLTIRKFSEQSSNGDNTYNKQMVYDPNAKTLTYSDEQIKNKVTTGIDPFDDALGLMLNMRAWSGSAAGHKYLFHMRSKDGERPATINFT